MQAARGLLGAGDRVLYARRIPSSGTPGADSGSTSAESGTATPTSPSSAEERRAGASVFAGATICGTEIAGDLVEILELSSTPRPTRTWTDDLYTCTYELADGPLVLSLKRSPDPASARGYFRSQQAQEGRTNRIVGLPSFGLPAFETRDGVVAYLQGRKVLRVDATDLPAAIGEDQLSPGDLAYQAATLVVGCGHGPGLHHEC